MKKNTKSITFQHAAAELCVSDSTILRLVQRGALHTTRPELVDGHWTRRIVLDRSFQDERARRLNGLKAPRRKTIPTEVTKYDPSPIQTVTPAEDAIEKCRNAMNICLETQKACETEVNKCKSIKKDLEGNFDKVNKWVRNWKDILKASELTNTRCTAVAATACILLILLAIYCSLCHFNII